MVRRPVVGRFREGTPPCSVTGCLCRLVCSLPFHVAPPGSAGEMASLGSVFHHARRRGVGITALAPESWIGSLNCLCGSLIRDSASQTVLVWDMSDELWPTCRLPQIERKLSRDHIQGGLANRDKAPTLSLRICRNTGNCCQCSAQCLRAMRPASASHTCCPLLSPACTPKMS